ncbi:MAG: hypothetical protein QXN05_03730 [Acidilobaceae archaeon]
MSLVWLTYATIEKLEERKEEDFEDEGQLEFYLTSHYALGC